MILATGGDSPLENTVARFRKSLAEGRLTVSSLEKAEWACLELLETCPSTPGIRGITMEFMEAIRIARQ